MRRSETGAIIVDGPSEEYERACLDAVRKALTESPTIERDGTTIHDVEIVEREGHRVIRVTMTYLGSAKTLEWRLYEDVFNGTLPPGQAEDPDGVATQMFVWAIGG